MQFFNFLGKTEFPGERGFLPVKVADSVANSTEDFPLCDVYYESGEVVISAPDASKKSVFICNDERALEVNNKIARNKDEDFLIMTDRVGFIENVKAYFRFVPFNGGILLCLYGGAIKINDGSDWLVLSRNGKGTKEGMTVYPITYDEFVSSISSSDATTGYNMVKDGVSSCEVYFTNNKQGVTKKTRSYKDEFTLLNDTNLQRATKEWERKEQELELRNKQQTERRKRYKIREEEFRRQEAEKEAEEKEKAKSKRSSTKKKEASPKDDSDAANDFISAVKKAGYTRK